MGMPLYAEAGWAPGPDDVRPVDRSLWAFAGPDEVHVWVASLDALTGDQAGWRPLLSAQERDRAARFIFDHDRTRYVARRALLRILLGRYLDLHPAGVSLCYGPFGKPGLAGGEISFNLSASSGCAVVALARHRSIGVDIERIRDIDGMDEIAGRFFAGPEFDRYRTRSRAARPLTFFEIWTRKEAVVKAAGGGLTIPLDSFDVSPGFGRAGRPVIAGGPDGRRRPWRVTGVGCGGGFAVAVAADGASPVSPSLRAFPGPFDLSEMSGRGLS